MQSLKLKFKKWREQNMNYSVGVDIGGTKVAIAVVTQEGKIIADTVIPTDLTISPEKMIERICETINNVMDQSQIAKADIVGIGIGAPGPLDSKAGVITCPPNLKSWIDIPIKKLVEARLSIPVTLENDANAAALAEKWVGAATDTENFTYITISTGVGAGVIVEGRLLRGLKGNAGDIGHTVVDPSYGTCPCGQDGCLEWIASGTAIARQGSEVLGKDVTTQEIFELYEQGDNQIVPLIDGILKVLGQACVTIINTFDPEKIVIGGGVSKVGDTLFNPIQDYISKFALNPTGRQTQVVPAKLDQSSGVIGAAALLFI